MDIPPFNDVRVRQAANYAMNRQDMVDMLQGVAVAATQTLIDTQPWYGKPVTYDYNPDKAKALLKEAGCMPCAIKVGISTSGSGQMQPLPMNELVKEQLEAVGFKVELEPMDWNALIGVFLAGVEEVRLQRHQLLHGADRSRPGHPEEMDDRLTRPPPAATGASSRTTRWIKLGARGAGRVRPGQAQRPADADERTAPSPTPPSSTSCTTSTRAPFAETLGLRAGAELVPGSDPDRGFALTAERLAARAASYARGEDSARSI